MEIGDRIREFGVKTFGSVSVLADKLGVSLQYLSPYLNSKNEPGTPLLRKLANLGCNINWLLNGEVSQNLFKEKNVEYITIDKVLNSDKVLFEYPVHADVPAGRGEINYHDWPEFIKLDLDPREHFALRIDEEYGYSMAPFIEPGDILFCRNNNTFNDGDIVVARYDKTKGAVKRIFINQQVTLISFNPVEKPIVINKKQLEQVFKVVLIWKKK